MSDPSTGKPASAFVLVIVSLATGCSGAPLGGNNQGSGGSDSGPCPGSVSCKPPTVGGATGGSSGTGGASGADGANCAELAVAYDTALTAALVCTPGAPDQCQTLVAALPANCPDLCSNQSFVNDGTLVETARENWLGAGCGGPPVACPAIACAPPSPSLSSACVSDGPDSASGTCVPLERDASIGTVPDGGESCDQLAADYATTVSAGRACTPGAPNQCQVAVNTAPSSCTPSRCDTAGWVSDATAVDAAQARWLAQCGTNEGCALVLCDPISVTCIPAASGDAGTATGLCTAVLTAPPI